MKAVRFRVEGRVQGVGFRMFTRRTAMDLGVAGWCRNTIDGAVEGQAEGPADAIDRFVAVLRQGPVHSRVVALDLDDAQPAGADHFEIRR